MIGQTQLYILLGLAVLLFGGSIVTRGVKQFYKTKKDIQETIIEEQKNEIKASSTTNSY